jgi:K+-sensing histidine kinase KdpD
LSFSELRNQRGWRRYLAALLVVVAATCIAEMLYRTLGTTRLSMIFLAGVLVAAVWLGSGPAYFAAGLAFVIYNFYLCEPRFTLVFADPEDVIVLTVFLIVAMLTGGLAGRVRDEAKRAQARARTTAALLEASRDFAATTQEAEIRERLARRLAEAAKGDAVIWDGAEAVTSHDDVAAPAPLLIDALDLANRAIGAVPVTLESGAWRARPLRSGEAVLGVAAWRLNGSEPPAAEEVQLVSVLVDQGATAIVRTRLAAAQAEVQASARTEQLRNALLSSISHDLRTPLAAILASASSLKAFGDRFTPEVRADLTDTIQEEAERLNLFVANLLNMTRLEGGGLAPKATPFNVVEVVDQLMARMERRRGGRVLTRDTAEGDFTAMGDPVLLEQALGNVIENALRFSPDGSTVRVSLAGGDGVRIQVTDEGPGVPEAELERIFEKFFRSAGSREITPGTGLGLSIARGLVEATGGRVRARLRNDRSGLVVAVDLPRAEAAA